MNAIALFSQWVLIKSEWKKSFSCSPYMDRRNVNPGPAHGAPRNRPFPESASEALTQVLSKLLVNDH